MNQELRDRLARVLGPGEPELTCDACFEEMDHYVDLERTGVDAEAVIPGMRAHLAGCGACAEDHAALHALLDAAEA